jgi:spermidine synthase
MFACCLLFFVSGAVALIYQILWMKELSLLFGNSAQAAAAVLAAFFAGLAAGNRFWGARAERLRNPLMTYAQLEVAIAGGALLYFVILQAYNVLYGMLFDHLYNYQFLFSALKFLSAFILLFPATFFMGGTLPTMAQFLIRNPTNLGRRASFLYAINTIGAASGAFSVGFLLPRQLGYDLSYLVALVGTLSVALVAALMARSLGDYKPHATPANKEQVSHDSQTLTAWVALISGLVTMMLQVFWIRMFVQVLQNSVYTFSIILVTFLVALAVGGWIAGFLARRKATSANVLVLLLSLSAILAAASPLVFFTATDGLRSIGGNTDFGTYLWQISGLVLLTVGLPVSIMGAVFPYLFKVAEQEHVSPGRVIGRLVTLNTIGAVIGSLLGGFAILSLLGLWPGIRLAAACYLVTAFAVLIQAQTPSRAAKLAPVVGLLLMFTILDTSRLPQVKVDPVKRDETLLQVWEDSTGTVAVIRSRGNLRTKLNNWYTLGGTGDRLTQEVQTHLPMLLHPKPEKVFYLGMGTGMTAGTALEYPVEEVVVAEIAPAVIEASRQFFEPYTNGLFHDPRVRIAAEDGRNFLRGTRTKFDLIISDLFIPWKAGTGSLYSREHYQRASDRLEENGLYAQWIPLYQVTDEEFFIIAKTMLEVFPQVTLWRAHFRSDRPVLALIGHQREESLDPTLPLMARSRLALEQNRQELTTFPIVSQYVGRLNKYEPRFADVQINTDAFPIIEQIAPINHRLERAGKKQWFIEEELLEYMADFLDWTALKNDAYLSDLPQTWLHTIQAGYYLQSLDLLRDLEHENAKLAENQALILFQRTLQDLEAGRPQP